MEEVEIEYILRYDKNGNQVRHSSRAIFPDCTSLRTLVADCISYQVELRTIVTKNSDFYVNGMWINYIGFQRFLAACRAIFPYESDLNKILLANPLIPNEIFNNVRYYREGRARFQELWDYIPLTSIWNIGIGPRQEALTNVMPELFQAAYFCELQGPSEEIAMIRLLFSDLIIPINII